MPILSRILSRDRAALAVEGAEAGAGSAVSELIAVQITFLLADGALMIFAIEFVFSGFCVLMPGIEILAYEVAFLFVHCGISFVSVYAGCAYGLYLIVCFTCLYPV